jgi:ABC-type dipeptide/oligopeptide/nickel transport system permease component
MKKQTAVTKRRVSAELDSVFVMKLVLYFLVGSFWVHLAIGQMVVPLPLGVVLGVWFASHEHFRIDRKIEYAVLLIAMFVTYFLAPKILLQF